MAHEEPLPKPETPDQILLAVINKASRAIASLAQLVLAAGNTIRFGPDGDNESEETNIEWLKREFENVEVDIEDVDFAITRFDRTIESMEVAEDS